MKRHPALQDLSRDHFHVLFRCQRFRKALERGAPWTELQPLVEEFLVFFDSDMSPHFQEEDELVIPEAARVAELQGLARATLDEHVELRRRIARLRAVRNSERDATQIIGELHGVIAAHVEMEETGLFEGVQRYLASGSLATLGRKSAEFRRKHRAPDASGPRPGRG